MLYDILKMMYIFYSYLFDCHSSMFALFCMFFLLFVTGFLLMLCNGFYIRHNTIICCVWFGNTHLLITQCACEKTLIADLFLRNQS